MRAAGRFATMRRCCPPPPRSPTSPIPAPPPPAHDLQLGRRFFHLVNGVTTATAYALLFTHEQVMHIFGTIACLVYIVDRVRIAYPEVVARHAPWVNRLFVRAEEQVRESAMIPYAIAVLLTILTVPEAGGARRHLHARDRRSARRRGRHPLRAAPHRAQPQPRGLARVLRRDARRSPRLVLALGHRRVAALVAGARAADRARRGGVRAAAAAHRRQPDDSALRRLHDLDRGRASASRWHRRLCYRAQPHDRRTRHPRRHRTGRAGAAPRGDAARAGRRRDRAHRAAEPDAERGHPPGARARARRAPRAPDLPARPVPRRARS